MDSISFLRMEDHNRVVTTGSSPVGIKQLKGFGVNILLNVKESYNRIGLKKRHKELTNIFRFLKISSINYWTSGALLNLETMSSAGGEFFCIDDYTRWQNLLTTESVALCLLAR